MIQEPEYFDATLFQAITSESGCFLAVDGSSIKLDTDSALFRRNIAMKLRAQVGYPQPVIENYLKGLQEYIDDNARFRSCLMPMIGGKLGKVGLTVSDSFIRILLSIDVLQTSLIDKLLERLFEFVGETENPDIQVSMPRLILQQLRWLDHIVEPEQLASKIVEMMEVTPNHIQREIITIIPEVITDFEHKGIVAKLISITEHSHELMVPALDCLSNLSLGQDFLDNIQNTVIERLVSADIDDLPVIVKFLGQSATPETSEELVKKMRQKLDFKSIAKLQRNQSVVTFQKNQNTRKVQAPDALILDALKSSFRLHKFLSDAWIKVITNVNSSEQHKTIDILVLLLLHSITTMKKKVETIFRKRISMGLITQKLLVDTISLHEAGLKEYFDTILSLSENLLRSSQKEPLIAKCASIIYSIACEEFDEYHRQEIIGSLVTHIGSGAPTEINSALSILLHLVQRDPAGMSRYAIFVKGILDYLDNLSMPQIRILFEIFSVLAYESETGGLRGNFLSELLIVIRKNLSNPLEKYKRMGVIGGLAIVEKLGSREGCVNLAGSSQQVKAEYCAEDAMNHPLIRQAVKILEMIKDTCTKSSSCLSLAYDELAILVSKNVLDCRLEIWIKEVMRALFSEKYVMVADEIIEYTQAFAENEVLLTKIWMDLDYGDDQKSEDRLAINIHSLLSVPSQSGDSILSLCSLFKLVQACEKAANDGNLDEIDGLLGCGIMMYKEIDPIDMKNYGSAMKEIICTLLFFAINWFREVINAFSSIDQDDIAVKVVVRLKNLEELETKLEEFLQATTGGFRPPGVGGNLVENKENIAPPRAISIQKKKSNEEKGSVTLKLKSQRNSVDGNGKDIFPKTAPLGRKFTTIAELRPFMRELEFDVFRVLSYGEMQHLLADTKLDEIASDTVKISHSQLKYLLQDLNRKLDHKFVYVPTAQLFGKKKVNVENMECGEFSILARMTPLQVIGKVNEILPHLLSKLEFINDEIQTMDSISKENSTDEKCLACVQMIFEILDKLFSGIDLKNPDNQEITMKLLYNIASRMRLEVSQQRRPIQDLVVQSFDYLNKFIDRAPTAVIAVLQHRLLTKVINLAPDPSPLNHQASILSRKILVTDWEVNDKEKIKNDLVYLLGQQIADANDPQELIGDFVKRILPAFESGDADILTEHPFLTKETFTSYYKTLSIQLNRLLMDFQEKEKNMDHDTAMVHAADLVELWQRLVSLVKGMDMRQILAILLKSGRGFVDGFTKTIMPFLNSHFKSHRNEIISILKHFQTATRTLQAICNHVKVIRDLSLNAYVPPMKRSLETILFQVKKVLADNGISLDDVFIVAALKQRNIAGEEVSSQFSKDSSEEGDEIEESDEINSDDKENTTLRQSHKSKRVLLTDGDAMLQTSVRKRAKTKADRVKEKRGASIENNRMSNSQADSSDVEDNESEEDDEAYDMEDEAEISEMEA